MSATTSSQAPIPGATRLPADAELHVLGLEPLLGLRGCVSFRARAGARSPSRAGTTHSGAAATSPTRSSAGPRPRPSPTSSRIGGLRVQQFASPTQPSVEEPEDGFMVGTTDSGADLVPAADARRSCARELVRGGLASLPCHDHAWSDAMLVRLTVGYQRMHGLEPVSPSIPTRSNWSTAPRWCSSPSSKKGAAEISDACRSAPSRSAVTRRHLNADLRRASPALHRTLFDFDVEQQRGAPT